MNKYIIKDTFKFREQLNNIINYIADDNNINVAFDILKEIKSEIENLKGLPLIGVIPKYSILRKQNYRALIIDNYIVFYKINETVKEIIIYTIVDGRQEYKNLI